AARMGYNLIEYNLREKGTSLERLQFVWWNSGLRGVLIGPFEIPGVTLEGNWDRWGTVAFGHSVVAPSFNRAVFDQFENTIIHLGKLRARGYRRIGFALSRRLSARTHGLLHAAYLLEQAQRSEENPIPVLAEEENPRALNAWIRKHKLDVIIGYADVYQLLM